MQSLSEREWDEDEIVEDDAIPEVHKNSPTDMSDSWRPETATVEKLQDGASRSSDLDEAGGDAASTEEVKLQLDPNEDIVVTPENVSEQFAGQYDRDELQEFTLDTRYEDRQFAARLAQAEERYERAVGDATADSPADAILQWLRHHNANKD